MTMGIDETTGLEKRRRFVSCNLTRDDHKIYFQEYYISPTGQRVGLKNLYYQSYPDRINYWNASLGDTVILPAILQALGQLQEKNGEYWIGTPEV